MTYDYRYSTHMGALIRAVDLTDGPIVEFGTGLFSTPYLHWVCEATGRKLVSYDNDPTYFEFYKSFIRPYHDVILVDDWDKIDLTGMWSVALIDHAPNRRRRAEVIRLANSAEYIVLHDSEPAVDGHYKYSTIYPLFKYRKDFRTEKPNTTVLSNFKDLSNL